MCVAFVGRVEGGNGGSGGTFDQLSRYTYTTRRLTAADGESGTREENGDEDQQQQKQLERTIDII